MSPRKFCFCIPKWLLTGLTMLRRKPARCGFLTESPRQDCGSCPSMTRRLPCMSTARRSFQVFFKCLCKHISFGEPAAFKTHHRNLGMCNRLVVGGAEYVLYKYETGPAPAQTQTAHHILSQSQCIQSLPFSTPGLCPAGACRQMRIRRFCKTHAGCAPCSEGNWRC